MATIASHTLNAIPQDAVEFAVQQGVSEFLQPLLEMTSRIFPDAAIRLLVETDAEDGSDHYLVVEVKVGKMAVAEAFALRQRWLEELFEQCPSTKTPVFVLGLELE